MSAPSGNNPHEREVISQTQTDAKRGGVKRKPKGRKTRWSMRVVLGMILLVMLAIGLASTSPPTSACMIQIPTQEIGTGITGWVPYVAITPATDMTWVNYPITSVRLTINNTQNLNGETTAAQAYAIGTRASVTREVAYDADRTVIVAANTTLLTDAQSATARTANAEFDRALCHDALGLGGADRTVMFAGQNATSTGGECVWPSGISAVAFG